MTPRHVLIVVMGIALTGLVIAAAVFVLGRDSSAPSPHVLSPQTSGVVVFELEGGLLLANVDGSGERELLPPYFTVVGSAEPSVSPDGSRIATIGEGGVYIVELAAGTRPRRIASGGAPSWSPDGSLIAFVGWRNAVWVARPDGSDARVVVPDSRDGGFGWSPDAKRIAAAGGIFDVATSEKIAIAALQSFGRIAWSPDGELIAFEQEDGLWVVRPDGSDALRLPGPAPSRIAGKGPKWSPDSQRIAYTAESGVFIVDVAAGTARRLTVSLAGEATSQPSWSPDGSRIAYVRERGRGWDAGADVWVVNADGSNDESITRTFRSGAASAVSWVPGLRRVDVAKEVPKAVPLQATRTVSIEREIAALEAEGDIAAIVTTPPGDSDYDVAVWTPDSPTIRRLAPVCGEGFSDLALSGSYVSWTCLSLGNSWRDASVNSARVAGGAPIVVLAKGGSGSENSIAGSGDLTVFTLNGTLWTLDAGRAQPLHTAFRYWDVEDVESGRIAAEGDGAMDVLSSTGHRITHLGKYSGVDQALLAGGSIVVARYSLSREVHVVSVYDVPSGRLSDRFEPRGAVTLHPLVLETARGRLVAYVTGSGLHIYDLPTKRDTLIQIPQLAGNINASFGNNGLFVSYTRATSPKPGRIAFVPWRLLPPLHRAP